MKRFLLLAFCLALAACSSTDDGSVQLVTGEETDTFSQSPAPTKLTVYAVDQSGNRTTLATSSYPATSLDLGNQDENAVAAIELVGRDAQGVEVIAGASLELQYGALVGSTFPLFVQRVEQFARLPSPPTDARQSPTLAIIAGEFLFVGGGATASSAQTTQLYDFASYAPLSGAPVMPRAPLSMPVVGTVGLAIDDTAGTYFDFSQGIQSADIQPPSGFTFADVAGGQSFYVTDTSYNLTDVYVVGATRTQGPATAAVLHINPNDTSNSNYPTGNLAWYALTAPRLGATSAWITGRGLVVTGGSASAAGVEVLGPGATSGTALPFGPDGSSGAGATQLGSDTGHLLVAGGITPTGQDAGVRVLDLSCASACEGMSGTAAWGKGLPIPLTSSTAFSLGSGGTYAALLVGSELISGLTHAYGLTSAGATEIPTKVPHVRASAIQSPVGSFLVFGGSDEIESFQSPL